LNGRFRIGVIAGGGARLEAVAEAAQVLETTADVTLVDRPWVGSADG